VCFEPQLLGFLADLILVPAQEARRGRERVAVIEGVPEVFEVHFGPGLTRICVHLSALVQTNARVSKAFMHRVIHQKRTPPSGATRGGVRDIRSTTEGLSPLPRMSISILHQDQVPVCRVPDARPIDFS
jgi:hypothetical protein